MAAKQKKFFGITQVGRWIDQRNHMFFSTSDVLRQMDRNKHPNLSWKIHYLESGQEILLPYWRNSALLWKEYYSGKPILK